MRTRDLPLTLMPGAGYEELLRNIKGHVTAAAILTARFEGHEVEELDAMGAPYPPSHTLVVCHP